MPSSFHDRHSGLLHPLTDILLQGAIGGEQVSRVSLCSRPAVRSDDLGGGTFSQDGDPTAHIQVQEVIWILRLDMRWNAAAVWQSSFASQEHSIKEKEKNLCMFLAEQKVNYVTLTGMYWYRNNSTKNTSFRILKTACLQLRTHGFTLLQTSSVRNN